MQFFTRAVRRLALIASVGLGVVACSDDPTGPDDDAINDGSLLLAVTIPDQSGQSGSSFFQTVSLAQQSVTNANAFEQTFFPYAFIRANTVIVAQGVYGDRAVRYVRGTDGKLTEGGRLELPAGGLGSNVVFASDTKAYLSLSYLGRIIVFNPQTMTKTGEIDLTTLGLARNPSNPADRNPEPAVMALHDGKLYVGLLQLTTGFASADGADIAVIDAMTDQFERVIRDTRITSPGRFGFPSTMAVDEQGDLYVYGHASFGFNPAQTSGILRIRKGATTFDPTYFVNITAANLPAGRIGILNGVAYIDGYLYATAEIPSLESVPPNYATDRAFLPIRIRLSTGSLEPLPLPPSTGMAAGITKLGGKIVFGLSTATGVGLYTYDPVTGAASQSPVVKTQGDPTIVLAF